LHGENKLLQALFPLTSNNFVLDIKNNFAKNQLIMVLAACFFD